MRGLDSQVSGLVEANYRSLNMFREFLPHVIRDLLRAQLIRRCQLRVSHTMVTCNLHSHNDITAPPPNL